MARRRAGASISCVCRHCAQLRETCSAAMAIMVRQKHASQPACVRGSPWSEPPAAFSDTQGHGASPRDKLGWQTQWSAVVNASMQSTRAGRRTHVRVPEVVHAGPRAALACLLGRGCASAHTGVHQQRDRDRGRVQGPGEADDGASQDSPKHHEPHRDVLRPYAQGREVCPPAAPCRLRQQFGANRDGMRPYVSNADSHGLLAPGGTPDRSSIVSWICPSCVHVATGGRTCKRMRAMCARREAPESRTSRYTALCRCWWRGTPRLIESVDALEEHRTRGRCPGAQTTCVSCARLVPVP